MKVRSKEVLSSLDFGKKFTPEDSKHLKEIQMMIMDDVDFLCKKYNLHYSLCFGTLLGAVRHHGYIPWDDDIDICLPSFEINDLMLNLSKEFGEKYFFAGYGIDEDPCVCLKVCLSGTEYLDYDMVGTGFKRGISIDVFPIIPLSSDIKTVVKTEKKLRNLTHRISLASEWKWKRIAFLKSDNKKVKRYYMMRRLAGFFASFAGYKTMLKKRQKMLKSSVNNYSDNSNCLIGFNQRIKTECLKASESVDLIDYKFEDRTYKGFKNSDKFLSFHFGRDYMKLPPVEKREKHSAYKVDFGNY